MRYTIGTNDMTVAQTLVAIADLLEPNPQYGFESTKLEAVCEILCVARMAAPGDLSIDQIGRLKHFARVLDDELDGLYLRMEAEEATSDTDRCSTDNGGLSGHE